MRFALSILLLAVFAAPADAVPPVKVRTTACTTSLEPGQRAARFEGDMRTVAGASRLQIRFTLQTKTAEKPEWTEVKAPGFGTWNTSTAGIGRFVYVKTVANLLAPASYRAVVSFRWLGATSKPILRARRASRLCRQPDLRPDLLPGRLVPDGDGDGYALTIVNEGRSDAGAFTVRLGDREIGRVKSLPAGARTTLHTAAPDCPPGKTITLHVDSDDEVDEADELGNVATHTCPGPVA